jgi:hypothetical protein
MYGKLVYLGVFLACSIGCGTLKVNAAGATQPLAPVGWWKAESNGLDSTFYHNDATLSGVTFSSGEVGQAFNTTSGNVVVPASGSLNVGTNSGFTIEGWIRPSTTNSAKPVFEWGNWSLGTMGVHVWIAAGTSGGDLYANLFDVGNNNHIINTPSGAIFANQFQHIALSYDTNSGIASLYLNGTLAQQSSLGSFVPKTTGELRLGNRPSWGNFNGLIDESALYGRVLTPLEILTIYRAGSTGKRLCATAPPGLAGFWKGENDGTDTSVNRNSLLMTNVGFTTGKVGDAFSFTAVSEPSLSVLAAPRLNLGIGDGLSIELWIYPTNVTGGMPVVEWTGGITNAGIGAHFWAPGAVAGDLYVNLKDTFGNNHIISSAGNILATNVFSHIAFTYNRTNGMARLFWNGFVVAATNLGVFVPDTEGVFQIGFRPSQGIYFGGLLDEVAVYNRELSIQEVRYVRGLPKCDCETVPDDLVGWWRAEENGDDMSSYANDASVANTAYLNANAGTGFSSTANISSATVTAPASGSLDVGAEDGFTVEAWIYPLANDARPIFEWGTYPSTEGPHFWSSVSTTDDFYANIVDTGGNAHAFSTAGGLLLMNQFQHVALTYDKTTGYGRIYFNGCLVAESNLGSFTPRTGNELRIGNRPSWANWQGMIDEASVYKRALSGTEIQDIYSAGAIGKCF